MRFFMEFSTNKSFWSIALLSIAVWSAISFYWAGYYRGKKLADSQISYQQQEIDRLHREIVILKNYSLRASFSTTKTRNQPL